MARNTTTRKATADKATADKATADKATADKATADKATAKPAVADAPAMTPEDAKRLKQITNAIAFVTSKDNAKKVTMADAMKPFRGTFKVDQLAHLPAFQSGDTPVLEALWYVTTKPEDDNALTRLRREKGITTPSNLLRARLARLYTSGRSLDAALGALNGKEVKMRGAGEAFAAHLLSFVKHDPDRISDAADEIAEMGEEYATLADAIRHLDVAMLRDIAKTK